MKQDIEILEALVGTVKLFVNLWEVGVSRENGGAGSEEVENRGVKRSRGLGER